MTTAFSNKEHVINNRLVFFIANIFCLGLLLVREIIQECWRRWNWRLSIN